MELRIDPKTYKELEAIEGAIRALNPALKGIIYGDMTFAVATRFKKEARAIPGYTDRTGQLRKSIRAVRVDAVDESGTKIPKGAAETLVGNRKAFYARFLEFGTEDRVTNAGRATGRVKPVGMLQKALDGYQAEAVEDGLKAARRSWGKLVNVANKRGKLSKRHARVITG